MRTVWDISNNKEKSELAYGKHPTQKPIRILKRMIKLSSKPGDIMFTPFAGSGSECVAAKMTGRSFIGVEIDEEKNTYKGYIIATDNSMTINYYDTSTNSTYEFTINYTKNNEEITTPDLTNSINSNDMTLDDTMEIMSKLQENKKLEKFITDLGLIES